MATMQELTIKRREGTGKAFVKRLRRDGAVPGVLYDGKKAESVTVDPKAVLRMIHGREGTTQLLTLRFDGEGGNGTPDEVVAGLRAGLAGRLFAAQALVVFTGALTLGLVATAVGPAIFHNHLRQISGQVDAEASAHVEEAYASANAVSFGIALLAALAAALAVSAYVARRVARPAAQLAAAAADIAEGRYTSSIQSPRIGGEFDTVAASFNAI